MKQTQRDLKYIIKRILIGVGITIILFNLKKCNVYALTKIEVSSNNVSKITNTTGKKKVGEYKDSLLDLEFYVDNNNSFNYYYPIIYKYRNQNDLIFAISGIVSIEDLSLENISLGSIGITKDNSITSQYSVQYPPNLYLYDNNTLICNVGSTCNSSNNAPFTSFNYMQYNFMVYNFTQDTVNSGMNSSIFGQYVYNNTNIDFYNSNVPFDLTMGTKDIDYTPPVQDPLANLTQVDLTNYGAVLLVPKSYETMLSDYSTTEQPAPGVFNTFLNLSFYTQYCTRQTLTNLTNTRDLIINNIGTSLGSLSASISGTCPTEPTETIMTYQYDMYSGMIPMGVLIYNNEVDDTPNSNGYGTSYVWYDSNVYDIYLIKDIDNFSADISFIDYDGTEKNLKVDEIPTFEEMAQYAIDNNVELNKSRLNSLFGNIKLPFGFLNRLNNTSCQALRFPFPNSNEIIIIPCMSQTYTNVVGDLVPTIALIINALITYRCIINLILICQTMMDADDDKLEVLDL